MSRLLETRCELCGSWMWCGRACAKDPRNEPVIVQNGHDVLETVSNVSSPVSLTKLTKAELAVEPVAKRKAYQRDLMRVRRAAKKAALASR